MSTLRFLGSGSAINLSRQPTSFAICHNSGQVLLVDTGSGINILRQLQIAKIPLAQISHVFITHTDFDHCGGLAPFLLSKELQKVIGSEKITILGSESVICKLQTLIEITSVDLFGLWGHRLHWQALALEKSYTIFPGMELQPIAVSHQPSEYQATGLIINVDGISICYSGDTRPHETLHNYARGVRILIHEATFSEEQKKLAHYLGHSTVADAARLTADVGVEHLILTHVNVPADSVSEAALIAEARKYFDGHIIVSSDLLLIDLCDMLP